MKNNKSSISRRDFMTKATLASAGLAIASLTHLAASSSDGPLGMGYLTGKIDSPAKLNGEKDGRVGFDRFTAENLKANWPIVEVLQKFGKIKNATPAQIAMAWVLAQKSFIVPIPGTRSVQHLEENLGSLNVELIATDLAQMEDAFSKLTVHGGRMHKAHFAQVEPA